MRRPVKLAATLALALPLGACLLAGCGDDETPQAEPAPADVDAIVAEVSTLAPALEAYYRGGGYPISLEDAGKTLVPAGVPLAPGHVLGGYTYDPQAREFVLCIEDQDSGAWASYDTAPMGVRDSGESGGCPS